MHLRSGTIYDYLPNQNQSPSPIQVEEEYYNNLENLFLQWKQIVDSFENEEEYYYNLDNLFPLWKLIVNAIVLHNYRMGCDDIPDFPYYDCFVEHISPHQMFQIIDTNMP